MLLSKVAGRCKYAALILVTMLCIMGLTIGFAQAQSAEEVLSDLFVSFSCELPCFQSIIPGVTTELEVEEMLINANQPYSNNGFTIQWQLDSQTFVTDGTTGTHALAVIKDNIVIQVMSPLNMPISAIEVVFGSPERVVEEQGIATMLYPQHGLAFLISNVGNAARAYHVISGITSDPYSYIAAPAGLSVTDACLTYGAWPCIAPTATPTATYPIVSAITPTTTYTPTPLCSTRTRRGESGR